MSTTVEVFIDQAGRASLVGRAFFTRSRTGVSTTFTYDSEYLSQGHPNIDPWLTLDAGSQHYDGLLPAFSDSSPDRWGRNLIVKEERSLAREENRKTRTLDEIDFLLGVSDESRQGALRFRLQGADEFVSRRGDVPALISLPRLLHAASRITTDDSPLTAVKDLLDTGTAGLGGARPKASVRMDSRALAIAKFPHASDQWNVMAWEATALDLLDGAGIATPERHLARVGDSSVLILRRFDRDRLDGHRIGYISAMTAASARDGEPGDYSDIASAMRDLSGDLPRDLLALFDRVVASVALRNTDDHLRNHGFLASGGQWTLSPAFDVNPNPDPAKRRSTSIAGADSPDDEIEGLLALASECGLTEDGARRRIAHVADSMQHWRASAQANGIHNKEIRMMAEAIEPRIRALESAGKSTARATRDSRTRGRCASGADA